MGPTAMGYGPRQEGGRFSILLSVHVRVQERIRFSWRQRAFGIRLGSVYVAMPLHAILRWLKPAITARVHTVP